MARPSHTRVAARHRLHTARGAVLLPAGSKLFHGTIEPFSGVLRPGGYDSVSWFSDSPSIAQLYIPRSGSSIYISSSNLARPDPDPTVQEIQKLVGLEYDYSEVEWGSNGRAKSYKPVDKAPWNRIGYNATSKLSKEWTEIENRMREIDTESTAAYDAWRSALKAKADPGAVKKRLDDLVDEDTKLRERLEEVKAKYAEAQNGYEKEIEKRLAAKGYEPWKNSEGRAGSRSYEFHMESGKVLPPGGATEGRLFIGTTQRDMKIWLKARGEGDLMNVQYHDVSGFRDARDEGLDGVLIDDFAQSEAHGNFGHLSVGLFGPALKDVRFKQVPATYEEFERGGKTKAYPKGSRPYFHRLF